MANIDWDQYEPVDQTAIAEAPKPAGSETQSEDGIDWSQYEPVEEQPKKKKREPHPDPRNEFLIKRGEEHQEEGFDILDLAKGGLAGVTAGISRLVPGLKPEGGTGFVGDVVGSVLPISLAIKGASIPLRALASKSPILQKQLQAFANLTGVATGGAIHGGIEQATESGEFKLPTVNDMLNHGAAWAAIDVALQALGWGGRFAKSLWDKARSSGKAVNEVLETTLKKAGTGDKAAEKAISILEEKPLEEVQREVKLAQKELEPTKAEGVAQKTLQEQTQERASDLRNRKVKEQDFKKLEESMGVQVKPYLPAEFEAERIAEEAISEDLTQKIENVSQRAATEKELGENIKADLETRFAAEKAETDALYDVAKQAESVTAGNLSKTAGKIVDQLKKIEGEGITLMPEGYPAAKKHLTQLLENIGYEVVLDEAGMIKEAVHKNNVSHAKLIEIKKRLNKIIEYDLLETSAGDLLKEPAALIRQDIRQGYGDKNSPTRKAFEQAEKKFGENAERRGKKSIKALRTTEKPESIAKVVKTPSGLADVKEVVSKEQFAQIERELLEHMKGLNEERAAKYYREVRPSLSTNTRSIAEEIIASKAPAASPTRRVAQRNKIQEMVIDDIAKASITGQRAEKALDLWKTKEGQQLIKHALENNPNKKEVLKYLTDQSFHDFQASVMAPDGTINFKKLNEFLRDPATAENVRLVAGEEGLNFLKQLETLSGRVQKNKSLIEGKIDKGSAREREKINEELDKLGRRRLEEIKAKNTQPTKAESAFEETFSKKNQANRKETQKSLETKGKERFKKAREKRENLTKEEKLAAEALEKSGILFKMDDWLNSYGFKAKGVLAALGIIQTGIIPGVAASVLYEVFFSLAKKKSVQDAIKKAAAPRTDPKHFLQAFEGLMKSQEEK